MKKVMWLSILSMGLTAACTPKVQLAAPDKPIEINLNVKIDQEVRVRLDKEVEDLIEDNPDLFTPIPVIADVFRDNMRRVGATDEDVEIVVGLAEADEIRHQMSDREFEVLVIDGDHSFEGVKRDFENYADHVVPGGYIIIDDYQGPSWPDVTRFVDETVFTDPRFEMVSGHLRTAVVRRHLDA